MDKDIVAAEAIHSDVAPGVAEAPHSDIANAVAGASSQILNRPGADPDPDPTSPPVVGQMLALVLTDYFLGINIKGSNIIFCNFWCIYIRQDSLH